MVFIIYIIDCTFEQFKADCFLINELMNKRRIWRFNEGGSITFDRSEMRFELDESQMPIKQETYAVIYFVIIVI